MIFRSQLSDFHQDHVKQYLNQLTLKLKEFMSDHRSNGWTRAAQPVLAASAWLERKTRLRSVESHRRMALNTRLCMRIRRQELFRGVMAGLKAEFSGWIDFAQRAPELDLRLIFEAAGVAVAVREDSPNDAKRTLADNVWQCTDERPAIALNPSVPEVLVNHTLLHELFHLTHPKGQGHTVSGTPVEILADCFAGEMLQPAPAAQNLITADVVEKSTAAALANNSAFMGPLLRHSRREAFLLVFRGGSDDNSLDQVLVPARPDHRDKYVLCPSRNILAASLFEKDCHESSLPNITGRIGVGILPYKHAADLQFVEPDGLYHRVDAGESVLKALQDMGALTPHFNAHMDLLHPQWGRFHIAKIYLADMQFGGGQGFYLMRRAQGRDVYARESGTQLHCFIVIMDNDGSLARRWSQNQAAGYPGGPLALPADLVDDKRGASFDDWAVAVEESFLKPPSLDAKAEMIVWQAHCIADRLLKGDAMTACECGDPDCFTFKLAIRLAFKIAGFKNSGLR